jgi:hypothetical protein
MFSSDAKSDHFKELLFLEICKSHMGPNQANMGLVPKMVYCCDQKFLHQKCCIGKCIVIKKNPLAWPKIWPF